MCAFVCVFVCLRVCVCLYVCIYMCMCECVCSLYASLLITGAYKHTVLIIIIEIHFAIKQIMKIYLNCRSNETFNLIIIWLVTRSIKCCILYVIRRGFCLQKLFFWFYLIRCYLFYCMQVNAYSLFLYYYYYNKCTSSTLLALLL